MATTYKPRSAEGEARRLAALRSPEVRAKMSAAQKGRPAVPGWKETQQRAWEANRKEVLSYSGVHSWVRRTWGKANACEVCQKVDLTGYSVNWANLDHKYSREREEWKMMCKRCHIDYDRVHNNVVYGGAAAERKNPTTHCLRGHEYTPENTRVSKLGHRGCKTCSRDSYTRKKRTQKSAAS